MIRAIIPNGQIRALEPLPAEWSDGREVTDEEAESVTPDDLDEWYRELQELGSAQYEPGEWEQIQAILDAADEQAKASVRRRWIWADGFVSSRHESSEQRPEQHIGGSRQMGPSFPR